MVERAVQQCVLSIVSKFLEHRDIDDEKVNVLPIFVQFFVGYCWVESGVSVDFCVRKRLSASYTHSLWIVQISVEIGVGDDHRIVWHVVAEPQYRLSLWLRHVLRQQRLRLLYCRRDRYADQDKDQERTGKVKAYSPGQPSQRSVECHSDVQRQKRQQRHNSERIHDSTAEQEYPESDGKERRQQLEAIHRTSQNVDEHGNSPRCKEDHVGLHPCIPARTKLPARYGRLQFL